MMTIMMMMTRSLQRKKIMKVATLMNEMNNVDVMSFADFLKELEMNLHTYLLAVRSSLCSPRIFLKRLFLIHMHAYLT